jgi:hypothetical protein
MTELDPQFRQSLRRLVGHAADTESDWKDVVARANRARRRSLVLALLAALSLVVFVSAALALGGDLWQLVSGKPVSTKRLSAEERRMFASLATGKPVLRTQPNAPALRHLGRDLSVRLLADQGGYTFYVIEIKGRHPGLCFATGHVGRPELFGSMVCPLAESGSDPSAFPSPEHPVLDSSSFELRAGDPYPHVFRLEGFAAVAVKRVGLLDEHDKVVASVPVINSTYLRATDLPRGRVEAIVAFDDAGHRVYCQDIAASDPCHTRSERKVPTSSGASTHTHRPLRPELKPSRLGRQVQRGESQAASVVVYEPGVAIFDLRLASAKLRRLAKAGSPGCLRARFLDGRWLTDELGASGEAVGRPGDDRLRVDLVLPGRFGVEHAVPPPYDGCEISGSYGHRWNDASGTRAPLEIPLSVTGRRFFNDRAAARDLADFVRSKRVQLIRLSASPKPALIELAQRFPSRVLELPSSTERAPEDAIGFWVGGSEIVFSTTSSTGKEFFVVAKRATLRLPTKNLGNLAFVF